MMNLMLMAGTAGSHLGAWRHPDAYSNTVMNLETMIDIAKNAERGKLDAIFIADGNGVRNLDKPGLFAANAQTSRPAVFEPVTLFAALSQHTEHLGFVATATTTYEEPFLLARKFASLDHISGGRSVWNVVTTQYAGDSKNFGLDEHVDRETRYERAQEFVEVVNGLWDSWAGDAFLQDKESGRFLDPSRVHVLNHKGKYLQVEGPLNVARSPQGRPILCMAGQSEQGKELAASLSEIMFAIGDTKEVAQREYNDTKSRMAKYGRKPEDLKILSAIAIYLGDTVEEAESRAESYKALIPSWVGLEFLSAAVLHDFTGYNLDDPFPELTDEVVGGTSRRRLISETAQREKLTIRQVYERELSSPGGRSLKGTVSSVADSMQEWFEDGACDGFVMQGPIVPTTTNEIVDKLIPELQRRGLFRTEYEHKTLRENMGLPIPKNPYFD
ncbi:MAG: xenobiotic compound DszA family monooxygenase [Bradyrhizobium sp.]|nr:xenobiotic compound DszA family monooxygenase [Bradyrhizobium sp.]